MLIRFSACCVLDARFRVDQPAGLPVPTDRTEDGRDPQDTFAALRNHRSGPIQNGHGSQGERPLPTFPPADSLVSTADVHHGRPIRAGMVDASRCSFHAADPHTQWRAFVGGDIHVWLTKFRVCDPPGRWGSHDSGTVANVFDGTGSVETRQTRSDGVGCAHHVRGENDLVDTRLLRMGRSSPLRRPPDEQRETLFDTMSSQRRGMLTRKWGFNDFTVRRKSSISRNVIPPTMNKSTTSDDCC
jgi:hypothetical protein